MIAVPLPPAVILDFRPVIFGICAVAEIRDMLYRFWTVVCWFGNAECRD